ncbi:MAG: hypothetical protein ABI317_03800 [Gaiellales bacterium]
MSTGKGRVAAGAERNLARSRAIPASPTSFLGLVVFAAVGLLVTVQIMRVDAVTHSAARTGVAV